MTQSKEPGLISDEAQLAAIEDTAKPTTEEDGDQPPVVLLTEDYQVEEDQSWGDD